MGVTNTLSKLKEYFEAWHNSNYDALHIKTKNKIDELEATINNLINNTIPSIGNRIGIVENRLNELDDQITQNAHKHDATDVKFSVSNNELWQGINSPTTVQSALDNLLTYTNAGLNDVIKVDVDAVDISTFNSSLTWDSHAYIHFTKLGSFGFCEFWIRFTSNIEKNTEVKICTIPQKYRPASNKYQDTYNWGKSITDQTDDGGIRVILRPDGEMRIRSTRKGPVNTIGTIIYINDDNVYVPSTPGG